MSSQQPWFRMHRAALHNPKIVTLTDRQYRAWVNCMMMTDNEGKLPSLRDISVHLRVSLPDAEALVCELVEAGLVDPLMDGPNRSYVMHDWGQHQQPSDNAAERMRKLREAKRSERVQNSSEHVRPRYGLESDKDKDITLASSTTRIAARETTKARKQSFNFDLGRGRGDGAVPQTLTKRAEGLGLPVDEIEAETKLKSKSNQAAYFTTVCVNRLRDQLPNIKEEVIRDALWSKSPSAYTAVMAAMMTLEAAR